MKSVDCVVFILLSSFCAIVWSSDIGLYPEVVSVVCNLGDKKTDLLNEDEEVAENNKTIPYTSRIESFSYKEEFVLVRGNHKLFQKRSSMKKEELQEQEMRQNWLRTYPNISIPVPWGLPVEVQIISTFPKGVGNLLYHMSTGLQFGHPEYVLAFHEASAKIMNTNFDLNDPTAVYTFSVDKEDLVFHRHEGHRCIIGFSSSGGSILKFSTVDRIEAKKRPQSFIDNMVIIEVPADSLFVLRFNGMVYHQFGPKDPNYPAFFAISVHTNERGGELTEELLEKVLKGEGSIPLLTEPISDEVSQLLQDPELLSHVKRYVLPRVDAAAFN